MAPETALEDAELRRRQAASQRGFYRTVASSSPNARAIDLGEVQAAVVPVRPWFGFFNTVLYSDPRALQEALPTLAEEYARAGVSAWSVWVPPGEGRARDLLACAGHVRESAPLLMAASISAIDLDPRMDLALLDQPTWELVARCNDRAHGVPEGWSMAAVFEHADDPASHLYAVGREGEALSALVAREQDGDCYFWFVATAPEAQRQGLASELMRHALRNARDRGCLTTTLESTPAGERTYAQLGYRPLGRLELWERRAS